MDKSGLSGDRSNQKIILNDGRQLAYAEFGDPDGKPVIYNHGYNGSRLEGYMIESAIDTAGIRLIVPDRPGIGNSTFQKGRKLLDWSHDVIALANALDIETFAMLGVSGGGPYTAACAYEIPERLSNIGIVVGMGPPHAPGVKDGNSWTIPGMNRFMRAAMLFSLALIVQNQPDRFVQQALASVSAPDQALLTQPDYQSAFIRGTQASYAQGGRGNAHEASIYASPWGFDISQIKSQVHLWYSEQDMLVHPSVGQFLAEQLPDSQVVVWSDEGHFSWGVKYMDDILSTLVE